MENIRIGIETDRPFQVGAYGYEIIIKSQMPLNADDPVELLIKTRNSPLKTKIIEIVDADQGIVLWTVEEGDFSVAGSHEIQVRQTGTGYKFLSPAEQIPVYHSIEG